jgi:hypothetical protein
MTRRVRDSGNGRWANTHGLRGLELRWRDQSLDAATVKILHDLVADIAEDVGGAANMSTRELWLAEGAAFAKFVIGQGFDFIVRRGTVFDDDGQFHPVLGKYLLAWMNTLRLNLVELGLRPDRAEKLPSLQEYLADRAAASEANAAPPVEADPAIASDAPDATADSQEDTEINE